MTCREFMYSSYQSLSYVGVAGCEKSRHDAAADWCLLQNPAA
jgi:hypothetical protein